MDHNSVILAALASGPTSEKGSASDAVESAHAELKGLVKQHFGGRADEERALEAYEETPDAGRERLKEVLDNTGAVEDFGIVAAAQKLLKLVDPEGAAAGKYAVTAKPLGMKIGH